MSCAIIASYIRTEVLGNYLVTHKSVDFILFPFAFSPKYFCLKALEDGYFN